MVSSRFLWVDTFRNDDLTNISLWNSQQPPPKFSKVVEFWTNLKFDFFAYNFLDINGVDRDSVRSLIKRPFCIFFYRLVWTLCVCDRPTTERLRTVSRGDSRANRWIDLQIPPVFYRTSHLPDPSRAAAQKLALLRIRNKRVTDRRTNQPTDGLKISCVQLILDDAFWCVLRSKRREVTIWKGFFYNIP